jgi:hypothetical protein
MGWLSKVWKGVKKTVKKIGKGIKSAFKSVGKFMGKLGIVGQIGLGLLLPGLGQMLGTWAVTAMGSANALVSAAGHFVNAAVQIGTKASSVFKTVTQGVTKVIGQTVGTVINKIPGAGDFIKELTVGKIDITEMKNFGDVFKTAQNVVLDVAKAGNDLFSMDTLTGNNKYGQAYIDKTMAELNATTTQPDIKTGEFADIDGVVPEDAGLTSADSSTLKSSTGPDLPPGQTSVVTADTSLLADPATAATANTTSVVTPAPTSVVTPDLTPASSASTQTYIPSPNLMDAQGLDLSNIDVTGQATDPSYLSKKFTEVKDYAIDKAGNIIPDAIDDTVATVTGLPSKYIKKVAGIDQQGDYIDRRTSSNIQLQDTGETSAIRSARAASFDPQAYAANQDFFNLNPWGNGASQYNLNKEYLTNLKSRLGQ